GLDLVVLLAAHGAGADEPAGADGVGGLELAVGDAELEVGLGLGQVGTEGAGVDLEEGVALLDEVAFLQGSLVDVAGDVGADVGGGEGVEPPGEVLVVDDLVGDGGGNVNLDGLFGSGAGGGAATGEEEGEDEGGQPQPAPGVGQRGGRGT